MAEEVRSRDQNNSNNLRQRMGKTWLLQNWHRKKEREKTGGEATVDIKEANKGLGGEKNWKTFLGKMNYGTWGK